MRIGIFARTFQRSTLDQVLGAIAALGIREVHFNFACAGLESLPGEILAQQCAEIREAFARYDLTMCGVSGTFNAIFPDKSVRAELTRRACLLIEHCQKLGTNLVSLCTGTCDANDMWKGHAANQDTEAWNNLCDTLETLLVVASRHGIYLGIEPERSNVINSAAQARRLLDQFRSGYLKIILDAANLFDDRNRVPMKAVLDEAFDLLGPDIIMAHAKEIVPQHDRSRTPGSGFLDWDYYLEKLIQSGFRGPLVIHNLNEVVVPTGISFLETNLARAGKTVRIT